MLSSAVLATLAPFAEGGSFDPLHPVWGVTFWTLVIFVVSAPLMWKNVYKPITEALAARDRRAEDAIRIAEESKIAAERARAETESALAQARNEAAAQVRDAKERAEAQAQALLDKAKQEAEASRQKAVADIEAERRRAVAEIRDLSVDLSMQAASKLLKREVGGEDQRRFVKDFLDNSRN
ncbi:MAG TPA: F0F1 ATP synthase subunit B [Planctomycetota bacterium]|nr:F0F1 ATP synthase subunit B [Planctomycetota bacterium]